MSYLPIFLNLKNHHILVVGGGHSGFQKVENLILFSNKITVVAPDIQQKIRALNINCLEEEYQLHHLKNIQIVFACTSNPKVNSQILQEAHSKNILVQAVQNLEKSDFISPAIFSFDKIVFALSSLGNDLKKTLTYKNKLKQLLKQKPNLLQARSK